MAQDSSAPESSRQDVDLDELEVEILIIAKNVQGLKATCQFLSRRGWPAYATNNISQAIEEIAAKRPDIILISFNHPNPAVLKLPDIISQTFNLTCIGFVEGNDTHSTNKLTQIKMRHKIFGQPSGPNFQRGIRRILGEQYNFNTDEKPVADRKEAAEKSDSVTVRGGKKAADAGIIMQKAEPSVTDKGAHVIAGEKKTRENQLMTPIPNSGAKGKGIVMSEGKGATDYGTVTQGSEELKVTNGKYTMEGKKRKKLKQIVEQSPARDAGGTLDSADKKAPGAPQAQAGDLVGMLKKSLFGDKAEEVVEPVEDKSTELIEKAVEKSLVEICEMAAPEAQALAMKLITRLAVFPVEAEVAAGYLVIGIDVAVGGDQQSFLKKCAEKLQATFQTMGVQGKLESGFWLDVPEVEFGPWAENAGTFSFKMKHQGHELGIAYFQMQGPLPKPRLTEDKSMYAIGIAEVSTDEPVNFKAYLWLKENQKYVLYLRDGRNLQPEQKKRLEENQVVDIFMKPVDVENLRMFMASAFLKTTIKKNSDAA